jgi:hypothetical protein
LLACLPQAAHRRQTRSHQIAHRLVSFIGNPDGRQLTGSMPLGEIDRVPPVGLDAIAWPARDQRRCDDHAAVAGRRQLPLDAVAARPRLVTEAQLAPGARQLVGQLAQGFRRVGDLPVLADLTSLVARGERYRMGDRSRKLAIIPRFREDRDPLAQLFVIDRELSDFCMQLRDLVFRTVRITFIEDGKHESQYAIPPDHELRGLHAKISSDRVDRFAGQHA